jgi:hypothetical protein
MLNFMMEDDLNKYVISNEQRWDERGARRNLMHYIGALSTWRIRSHLFLGALAFACTDSK